MALREIRVLGENGSESLRKTCKPVVKMTPRIKDLISDMLETMYDAEGVGLAAPQVGILRRIVVIDIGEGPLVLINPKILQKVGEQEGYEGCLSIPGMSAWVKRPMKVVFTALDENLEEFTAEAEGLLARAVCHETDHLDGVMYADIADGPLMRNEDIYAEQEDLDEEDADAEDVDEAETENEEN